ncbi:amidase family protein [Roseobacter ponti]|uniref:Amidase family protein n=1 Tax=Roseobacter ponti TaxID=1891787 RepID=A0A858SSJ7_9RHOB|nr:amidase family protein [Roseobacter ponti]QJF51889.1 amidase family protein [Roseobacter ponti]
MTDLFRQSAATLARMIREKTVSAVEVAQAHIDRTDAVNPGINAVVQDARDEALMTARAIDTEIAAGEDPGLLAGVPCTTKVNVDQQGFATTNGLTLLKDAVAAEDSPVIANLRKAGGVITGRTNTPAFSLRWFTKNNLYGQTLNPRNHAITPGGSSGGAAAAVASGICAVAHGTDIAGSVRYPAYACGIHGLRPTFGRVPTFNATGGDRFIGAQLMAVSGPLARTIEDIGLAFAAMSAPDPRDPWHVPVSHAPQPFKKTAALTPAPDGMPVAREVTAAVQAAAQALEAKGWTVEEVPCPPMREAARINATLWMAETRFAAETMIRDEGDQDAQTVFEFMRRDAEPADLEAVMKALQRRAGLVREWALFFQKYPLLLCPVSGELPFDQQSDVRSEEDFYRIFEAQLTQRGLPSLGVPALSVATGMAGDRPVGVQLVSDRFREDILLAAGAVIEAAHPPLPVI